MQFPRASGILLHPTSLPGSYGIGDLGPQAFRFVDFLRASGQHIWQVLPLGPTGYGDSPYQCFSAFAGNSLLISPDLLLEQGHLTSEDLSASPDFARDRVDYGPVIQFKAALLGRACEAFFRSSPPTQMAEFQAFCQDHASWLQDYALFMALKDQHGGVQWTSWEPALAHREPDELARCRRELATEIRRHEYLQYQFHRQWSALRQYVHDAGLVIIGDIPIFVAHDSADVWAHRELFQLDEEGQPTVVAGVPPDYFSETGQLWGNPHYRWDRMASEGYQWWIERFRSLLQLVDIVRLDHFRGFAGYWEVPAGERTAVRGRWVKGPGPDLFEALRSQLGKLPIIAEDLGVITPDVEQLRDRFQLPGMRVLQFAFASDADDPFLPHNYVRNCVVYSGTHDNDTVAGWFQTAAAEERSSVRTYFGTDGADISWDMIRWLFASVADTAIVPMQDVLALGSEARMNYPSRLGGNWSWRFRSEDLTPGLRERLRGITEAYGRCEATPESTETDRSSPS